MAGDGGTNALIWCVSNLLPPPLTLLPHITEKMLEYTANASVYRHFEPNANVPLSRRRSCVFQHHLVHNTFPVPYLVYKIHIVNSMNTERVRKKYVRLVYIFFELRIIVEQRPAEGPNLGVSHIYTCRHTAHECVVYLLNVPLP